jgi:polar amino acid transport system permease protein
MECQPGSAALMDTLYTLLGYVLNLDILERYGMRMLAGLGLTLMLVAISVTLGFLLAYPIAQARIGGPWYLNGPAYAFINFFRGTPLLAQLYLVYYGSGQFRPFLSDIGLWTFFRDAFFCAILTFTMNTAAYQAEVFRGALLSVPRGQVEAAKALGLSKFRINRHIVWPQALMVALRPLGNELILMVKASSIASLVTLYDLMGATKLAFARSFDLSVYVYAAIIYLAIVELIRRIWNVMERRLLRHQIAAR